MLPLAREDDKDYKLTHLRDHCPALTAPEPWMRMRSLSRFSRASADMKKKLPVFLSTSFCQSDSVIYFMFLSAVVDCSHNEIIGVEWCNIINKLTQIIILNLDGQAENRGVVTCKYYNKIQ